jgi:DNA-binding MarR family transcriptional regulator
MFLETILPNGLDTDRTAPKEALVDQAISSLGAAIRLENTFGINFLTQEARMLALIKSTPGRSLKFYLTSSGLSPRWFSITIHKLVQAGLVEKLSSETDERSKTLR